MKPIESRTSFHLKPPDDERSSVVSSTAQFARPAPPSFRSPLAQAAVTHMRSQLSASAGRPGDAALTELAGTTEFTGDSSWFADY